jgi:hypothetical protein
MKEFTLRDWALGIAALIVATAWWLNIILTMIDVVLPGSPLHLQEWYQSDNGARECEPGAGCHGIPD